MEKEVEAEEEDVKIKYEYYIHYIGDDRRNDKWVTEHYLKIDLNEMAIQEKKLKDKQAQDDYLNHDEHEGMTPKDIQNHEKNTYMKTVESIHFGEHWLEAWYFTPLPKEFHCKCLYICDFCFFFCVSKQDFQRHATTCTVRCPPGDEIYRDKKGGREIAFFEVDGAAQRVYCENLSYISRMYLDHKNIGFSIEPFLFYCLCEVKEDGFHFVGYFSKEKNNEIS